MLLALMPHMHLRGKSMRFVAEYPDGRREVILDVPRYEFDWQNLYTLDRPKPMPEGTIIHTEAHFDNSDENPNNPDPRRAVTFGEQTWDEMHVGYLCFALADQDLALGMPTSKRLANGQYEVTFRHRPAGAGEVGRPRRHVHRLEGTASRHDRTGRPGGLLDDDRARPRGARVQVPPRRRDLPRRPGQPRFGRLLPQQPDPAALSRAGSGRADQSCLSAVTRSTRAACRAG